MSRRIAPPDPTALLLAMAAGRLLLHRPNADLAAIAGTLSTPEALAEAEDRLLAVLDATDTPLARLARAAGLSGFDLDLLGLAVLPALDDRAAETIAALSGGGRRLTAARAARLLLPADHDGAALRRALRDCPLWRAGLLRAADPGSPGERLLDPSPALLAALDDMWPEAVSGGWTVQARFAAGSAPASLAEHMEAVALWATGGTPALLLIEASRRERAIEVLAWVAASSGHPALLLHAPPPREHGEADLPPWAEAGVIAAATGALVALVSGAPLLPGPPVAPIAPVALIGPQGLRDARASLRRITLPRPRMSEQKARWLRAVPGLPDADAGALAAQTWLTEADIAGIADAARGHATSDLLAARMQTVPPAGGRLARLLVPAMAWDRLVLDAETKALLEDVVRRFRHRATVRDAWGMDHGGPALVALLSGEPGTGKTLAAEAIATRLGLPLLAADLSRLVSKYIGETEKNLSDLFAAAEGFAAVLFFDEADSLFGKRTSVQDAHDRYANIEVNYLLQRLESFEGVALLATNLAQGLDEAFLRRFDLMVPIARPGPAQRAALWETHLPVGLRAEGLDLGRFAAAFDVTGGEIRNAALTAAYAAAAAHVPIGGRLLRQALAREYAKQGRPFPDLADEPAETGRITRPEGGFA